MGAVLRVISAAQAKMEFAVLLDYVVEERVTT
jgi:hypothetical protein